MCGIAGLLEPRAGSREELTAIARGMADAIAHRGPDDAGVWVDERAGIALGHRRLSILDLSPDGHQPMLSMDGRFAIAFNGEIYNFRALRSELESAGHRFRGSSDTAVMLEALCRWGIDGALRRFNGMFAFAAWDRERRTLHLARDRLGEKPLYYGWLDGGRFVFGSELKALRAHPGFAGEIDREALAIYFHHGYVPAPRSIYRGVRKLPAGSVLTVGGVGRDERAEPVAYWSLADALARAAEEPYRGSADDAVRELEALLGDAVELRMESDVPLGAFLSGGIDSSTVVALMQARSARPVKTFSIGFHEAEYDEAQYAARVARHLGTEHTELYVTPHEARAVIPRLPSIYDEPFADSSQIPTTLVSAMARRHVTVSLSGDGGDELFCGYGRYRRSRRTWRAIDLLPLGLRRFAGATVGRLAALEGGRLPVGELLSKLGRRLGAESREALYLQLVTYWSSGAPVRGSADRARLFDGVRLPATRSFEEAMMALDALTYLPDDILAKVDRASMSVALETRVPLLDHRVVELAFRMPIELKVRGGRTKWLLRRVLDRHVPAALIDRPKMGFGVPIGRWLRGPLRDWAEALLDERRLSDEGLLDPRPIRRRWREHLTGRRDWQFDLWIVLMFEAWREAVRGAAIPARVVEPVPLSC